ncbi:hypothetical protein D0N37_18880 [Pseudoalteromonas piscicida]|nr:hypothetical protein D0N37_18880 [Pseudoalteromonas piscicida]
MELRKKLISEQFIYCPCCGFTLQPSILWTVVICFSFSFLFKTTFHSVIADKFGSIAAILIILVFVYIFHRLLEPLAALKAIDKNEFL